MANKLSVAFIGTGIMGAPIAGHILDAGYPVTVNNRTKSKAAALVERGAVWADTPADAAANADVVFTMVGIPPRSRSSTWRATACSRALSPVRS